MKDKRFQEKLSKEIEQLQNNVKEINNEAVRKAYLDWDLQKEKERFLLK